MPENEPCRRSSTRFAQQVVNYITLREDLATSAPDAVHSLQMDPIGSIDISGDTCSPLRPRQAVATGFALHAGYAVA